MPFHPNLIPTRRAGLGILCAVVALLWSGIFLHLAALYHQAERATVHDSGNLAQGLEQHVIRLLGGADQTLRFLQAAFRRDPASFNLFDWSEVIRSHEELTIQLAHIGADGILRASSVARSTAPVDLSDREHFRIHRDRPDDALFISRPVLGRVSQRWTVQLTRRLSNPDGSFAGVLVLSLDAENFSRIYGTLQLENASLTVAGLDGIIRARAPHVPRAIGEPVSAHTLAQITGREAGSYREASALDGVDRIVSFRRVQGHPLVVAMGISTAQAFAEYHLWRNTLVVGGTMLSLGMVWITLMLLRQGERVVRSERTLSQTLERMSQGVIMAGQDGQVRVVTNRARDLLELPPHLAALDVPVADVLAHLRANGQQVPEAGMSAERRRSDGAWVALDLESLPTGGTLITCTDITEQQQAIAAQQEATRAAKAASRAKSDFLANMSHEIRTPMNGVVGMIQVLRHSGLSAEQREMCETITRSADALLTVLNDILDYSKLEAGKIVLEPLPCRLEHLVSDVVGLMRHGAEVKALSLRLDIHDDLPVVVVDPTRLRQVLVNLLSNAIKFSEFGEITVTLAGEPEPAGDRLDVRIIVRDQGIGMSEEAQAKLFNRFTQADASSTRRFGGSGLGLSISRELVTMMGGDIAVWSKQDEGSEFTVRLSLPVSTIQPEELSPEEASPEGPLTRLRILVAEDDQVNRMVIKAFLEPDGHQVTFAYNGVDAVIEMRRKEFDIILMDVMMPGMDGPEATRQIRKLGGRAAMIPIIALTANAMPGDRERYLEAGMDGYVSKPVNRRELFSTIEKLLGVNAFRRSEAPALPAAEQPVAAEVAAELDDIMAGLGA